MVDARNGNFALTFFVLAHDFGARNRQVMLMKRQALRRPAGHLLEWRLFRSAVKAPAINGEDT